METKRFSLDWVMDPNPNDCEFTEQPGQTAGILIIIKEYLDKCEVEKVNLIKNIVDLLEKNKTVINPK